MSRKTQTFNINNHQIIVSNFMLVLGKSFLNLVMDIYCYKNYKVFPNLLSMWIEYFNLYYQKRFQCLKKKLNATIMLSECKYFFILTEYTNEEDDHEVSQQKIETKIHLDSLSNVS